MVGLIGMAPFYLHEIANGRHLIATAQSISVLAYTGIFPSILAFVFWNYGVRRIGPNRASLFLHLVPVFGSIVSILFLGERLFLFHLFGMALIFAGIYLSTAQRFAHES
jgi:drug/metabolite transporter (DMT)-like permease